jgi:hypothetical protein
MALRTLFEEEHPFKWAVIDTIGGVEHLCAQMVCERDFGGVWNTKKGQEGFNSYGKGDKATAQEMRQFLSLCDGIQQKRDMGVILLAHGGLHKQANVLGQDFMKFGADMNKNSWALVCGWADQVANACREFRASVREGEIKAKAKETSKDRWLVFEGGPGIDAKGRAGYDMPDRILLNWDEYAKALNQDNVEDLIDPVRALIDDAPKEITDILAKKLGGEITDKSLRKVGRAKLKATINWLESKKEVQS